MLEDKLKDPAFVDKMARFVKASMKGWDYAREQPGRGGRRSCSTTTTTGAQTEKHQTRMMGEINKLTEGSNGALDAGRRRAHRRRRCSPAAPIRSSPRSRKAPGPTP